jgi:two-component system, NtrC family, sensor kinase
MPEVSPAAIDFLVEGNPQRTCGVLQSVLDHIPFSIFWKNREGQIVGCNDTLVKTFGRARVDILGRTLGELVPNGELYDSLHEEVMSVGNTVVQDDFIGDFAAVGHKQLRRTLVPLRDDTGAVSGMVSAIEDRTEVVRLEQQLLQAQKLESVGQLAAGIAHEINTPMQYIGDNTHFLKATIVRLLGVAEAAQAAVADGASADDRQVLIETLQKSKLVMLAERAPKAADDALAGVENVSRIVTAMKRFSHPGSGEMAPVDLNEGINTTMMVCRSEWKYAARIETELAEDLPLVDGNLGPLNQVWLNMIVNATHAILDRHGDTEGVITIATSVIDDGEAVQVSIGDNGAGISEENLAKVFDHFFTTKEVGKGTGQGLAIAHQVIVSEHNGSLTVASTPGQGTTFTITLPTTHTPTNTETTS